MYQERFYRDYVKTTLKSTTIIQNESDLNILYSDSLDGSPEYIESIRGILIDHIKKYPKFSESLVPVRINKNDPPIIRHMKKASRAAAVGPMASVAGAVSQYLGEFLDDKNSDLIIENGGDIYMKTSVDRSILIHCGDSPLSDKLAIKITKEMSPIGICTSSGRLGHSLSFGKADAVVVLSKDTLVADSFATSICNMVKTAEDIETAIKFGSKCKEILGIVIIIDDSLGVWGNIELAPVN